MLAITSFMIILIISFSSCRNCYVYLSLQIRKRRLREAKQLVESHTVTKWLSKNLDLDLFGCTVHAFTVPGLR